MLTPWPPGPEAQKRSIRRSFSAISTLDLLGLGEDGHGRGRGVDAPLGLRLGDPLDAVDAPLVLEAGEGAFPLDDRLDFLEAAPAARLGAVDDLDPPAAPLGVADVHPEQLLGEEGGLVAAGPGADLEDDVLAVVRVLREEEDPDLLLERLDPDLERVGLGLRHVAELVARGERVEHLPGAGEVGLRLAQLADLLHDGGDLPHRAVDLRRLLVIGGDVGAPEALLERRVASLDLGELLEHPRFPGQEGKGRAGVLRRWWRQPRRRRPCPTWRTASGSARRGRRYRSAWPCR